MKYLTSRTVEFRHPKLAPRPALGPTRRLETVHVLGLKIIRAKLAETVYWIADRAQSCTPTRVAFLNAHCVNLAKRDWRYLDTLRTVDVLLPDGAGISLAAKFEKVQLGDNLNGTDVFAPLCRCLAFRKIPVFFLGGQPGIAKKTAEIAENNYPGLQVTGARNGYFAPRDEDTVIAEINQSGARVVFVAFGVPDQDIWIARIQNRLNAPVILGVGGLFDFVSGRIPRAPLWMRRRGIEWLFRLKCEPSRMWKRYLIGNFSFAANAATHAARVRLSKLTPTLDKHAKRGLDIVGSALGLVILAPLLMVTALTIRLESRGPALFRQIRVGEDGAEFELLKFRSMRVGTPAQDIMRNVANDRDDGVTFKLKCDPRVTRIGAFIRKYSIDELPQLWNVLKGDMSLVGPRPALPCEVSKYTATERQRLCGKPGLTCTWQISGRADLPFDKQVELDLKYLRSRSIWLDLAILARTPLAVLQARGAY